MDRKHELLTITMEECAEVIQQCSKVIRFGETYENLEKLEKELGDLYCMMNLLQEEDMVSWTKIDEQSQKKVDKLKIYSTLYE
jgi:NTP pyrophosphatase (non-canonical NTP hydrolase)